jgi:hypothetical protein
MKNICSSSEKFENDIVAIPMRFVYRISVLPSSKVGNC